MTWATFHKSSEGLAAAAHEALHIGNFSQAENLFAQAAEKEEYALTYLKLQEKPRTFGITSVSAVALWYKARELSRAERLAHQVLAIAEVPEFAVEQLRGLLQTIWNENIQETARVSFAPGQILVSVKGGQVVRGGAPLDLVVDKVQTIQAIFYRTAEFLQNLPFRHRGPAPREIQDSYRPWLFQSVPGSYQFVVAIQSPKQTDMFTNNQPEPQLVASTFFSIIKESAEDSAGEGLSQLIPDKEYKATFLKLARNLAPSGQTFSQLEIRASGHINPIVLSQESRKSISKTLRCERPVETNDDQHSPISLSGILRAVHLDDDWLELCVDGKQVRIEEVVETVDDVIGPMVNHQVTVQAVRDSKDKYYFRDIELEE
ncbi:MAG: hypothetical protein WCI11_07270 [Candidatus Methylumidiphilus sp.]